MRKISCDHCGFEVELSSSPSITESRATIQGEELVADHCPKCRSEIREMFPKEEELTVPAFMERVPVDEDALAEHHGWDGIDRAQVPV